jgi:CDP-diacylglycerol--glycerol-3-phosphate 3-phosphatidyltransferase
MGIYATKSRWQQALQPVVAACVRRRVHPDTFTAAALALSLAAGLALLLAGRWPSLLWIVPPCVLARLLCNLMDGQVARALNVADVWGEAKNEFGDRAADVIVFVGLIFGGYAAPGLAAVVLALILCSSYLGVLSKALGGPRLYAGVFGKGDRMLSLAAFTIWPALTGRLGSFDWYLLAALAAAGLTIVQRLRAIHAEATGLQSHSAGRTPWTH